MSVDVRHGDCLAVLPTLADNSIDAIVTDPPYGLGFMGKAWDDLPPGEDWARECLRVLKPGGHLLAFGGTRTWHRLACAVEDAGFEMRDSIAWLYSQGFPKSLNVSKIDTFCQCATIESPYGSEARMDTSEQIGRTGVSGLRGDVSPVAVEAAGESAADVLSTVSREAVCGRTGGAGSARSKGLDDGPPAALRVGQPVMEGRGDLPAREGQLHRASLRPLPAGVLADGPSGRLHHGASASDGSVGRSAVDSDGVRQPHQPEPSGQPQGESGAVSDERGSQARGVWPVCAGCGKSVVLKGLGTALKPAFEPIVVARKPLTGTVAQNVTTWGTGALNVDGCRIETDDLNGGAYAKVGNRSVSASLHAGSGMNVPGATTGKEYVAPAGRWPANVVLDESQAAALDEQSGTSASRSGGLSTKALGVMNDDAWVARDVPRTGHDDAGGASRFYYVAKAPKKERPVVDGVAHPTVKPLALMRWLVRLVTPPGGTVLDTFAGSGATVEAALLEGCNAVAIEREREYLPLIKERIMRADLGLFTGAA